MKLNTSATALLLSVALNCILIGLFAGMMLNRSAGGYAGDRNGPDRPAIDRGTFAENRALRLAFREAGEATRAQRRAQDAARRKLYDILSASEFDPEAAEVAFAELRARETDLRSSLEDFLLVRMADMPAEQRARIARRLLRRPGDDRRRRRQGSEPRP